MVDICRLMIDKFPKLRKLTINTTGLTPHRAIPMLTKVVEMCHERNVIFSTRVSIDGVDDMHGEVRNVRKAFEKAGKTIAAMQELQKKYRFNFGISSTIFSKNLDDADNILAWAKKEKLDIVFNMVRFTDAMLGNAELERTLKPMGAEEQRMRQFFMERVRQDPLLDGQNYIYMHYADMIANGYHRLAPCPFQTQGVMLNPNGDLFFCENSDVVGNVTQEDPEAIYFRDDAQAHRKHDSRREVPELPQPVPDERRGHQAGRAVRQVPGARLDGEAPAVSRCAGRAAAGGGRGAVDGRLIPVQSGRGRSRTIYSVINCLKLYFQIM